MRKYMDIKDLYRKYKFKGYIGPKYKGLMGKIKLFLQGNIGHYEVVVFAESSFWDRCNYKIDSGFNLQIIKDYESCIPYLEEIDNAYYKGFTLSWEMYFSWGETLFLVFLNGQIALYMWLQSGDDTKKCYYTPLKPEEYRFYRGGTLPHMQNKKAFTSAHVLALEYLLNKGAKRVFTEAFEDNVYSTKGHMSSGYKIFGRIFVGRSLLRKQYIRWV